MIPIYNDTINYMNEEYPFQVRPVLACGTPTSSTQYPLCHVVWEDDSSYIAVNEENLEKLDGEARTFVFVKEAMHTLLNHRKLKFDDMKRAEIAADIVVNDYLLTLGLPMFEGVNYGDDVLGFSSYGFTVTEVYYMLPPEPQLPSMAAAGGGDGDSDGDGDGLAQMLQEQLEQLSEEAQQQAAEGEGQTGDLPKEMEQEVPADLKDAGEKFSESGKLAGVGHTDLKAWAEQQKVEFAWAEIIADIVPKAFKAPKRHRSTVTFNRLNRKVAYAAPKVILPIYRTLNAEGKNEDGKKPRIVLAVDTSGSINTQTMNRFFRIAKSIPTDDCELSCLSFTDYVVEFDLEHPKYARGGTNFRPIEDWILNNCPEYPDAVIVFTDGYAGFGYGSQKFPKHMDRWMWFICQSGRAPLGYKEKSKLVDKLERFAK